MSRWGLATLHSFINMTSRAYETLERLRARGAAGGVDHRVTLQERCPSGGAPFSAAADGSDAFLCLRHHFADLVQHLSSRRNVKTRTPFRGTATVCSIESRGQWPIACNDLPAIFLGLNRRPPVINRRLDGEHHVFAQHQTRVRLSPCLPRSGLR